MIKRTCKYCKQELEFDNHYQFGGHVRNCKSRPDIKEVNERARQGQIKRKLVDISCEKCGKIYQLQLTDYEVKIGKHRKYCSTECRKKEMVDRVCLNCGKILENNQNIYCNHQCQHEYTYKQYIERWKNGLETGMRGKNGISIPLRRYIFEKNNNKCQKCGWSQENVYTKSIPLTVHHIDGNHTNNNEDNLELLCPNCHSLTENYGSRNNNCVREDRRKNKRD